MNKIVNALMLSVLMLVTACATTNQATETELALCVVWGDSLSTRSKADTQATQDGIGDSYGDFKVQCPKSTWPKWLEE